MAVTIEEVTAEVSPRESNSPSRPAPEPQRPSPLLEQRRQRELFMRMQQRAARVCTD